MRSEEKQKGGFYSYPSPYYHSAVKHPYMDNNVSRIFLHCAMFNP